MNSSLPSKSAHFSFSLIFTFSVLISQLSAVEYFVAPGGTGTGTSTSPFGKIQYALNVAKAGDIVTVRAGNYSEALSTKAAGTSSARITLRAEGARGTVINKYGSGTMMSIGHPYWTVQGIVFDGNWGVIDGIQVGSGADYLLFQNNEICNTQKDGIDMSGPENVTIDGCVIHNCLRWDPIDGRIDAHCIVAGGPAFNLTVKNTECYDFSGDAVQLDPNRTAPGWDWLVIENCHFWLRPLPTALVGYAAGMVPGENGLDTKTYATATFKATVKIKNTVCHGFKNGLISNMAAFNLKENIDATLDGVTVYDCEIGFRCRGPGSQPGSNSVIRNAVAYNCLKVCRYEDNVAKAWFENCTFGSGNSAFFQAASSTRTGVSVKNCLFYGSTLPVEAPAANANKVASSSLFVGSASQNYHLVAGATAIDTGMVLSGVTTDRDGAARPQGAAYDVGAYEYAGTVVVPVLTSVTVSPSSASVAAGATKQFTATAKDQNGNPMPVQPSFAWTASGGGTISATGLFTAGSTAGGPFTVTASTGGKSGTASVTVTVVPVLTSITVSPSSASVATGATKQFTAVAKDQAGVAMSTQPTFAWTVSGGGTISSTGLFTAGSTAGGPFTVTASAGGKAGTASVTVSAINLAPTVATAAKATPSPVIGTSTVLSALGADDAGEAALTYTWATTGTPPAAVTFSANGSNGAKNSTATFTKSGSYSFQVTIKDAQGLTVTSPVSVVVNQAMASVTVSPSSASVSTSTTKQFTAAAKDQFGAAMSATFTWSVSGGGTINSSGLFTAGSTAGGPFTVTATSGSKSGTASITVTAVSAPITLINFGASATANTFGLTGWNTVIQDHYTGYTSAGPDGTKIVTGSNGGYNYQGVKGSSRSFKAGEVIQVTWYNSSTAAITFTPKVSLNDPDRRASGVLGDWYAMNTITIPASGTVVSQFTVPATANYSVVNVTMNYSNAGLLVCDKIVLVPVP
jgi:hypothetical protein